MSPSLEYAKDTFIRGLLTYDRSDGSELGLWSWWIGKMLRVLVGFEKEGWALAKFRVLRPRQLYANHMQEIQRKVSIPQLANKAVHQVATFSQSYNAMKQNPNHTQTLLFQNLNTKFQIKWRPLPQLKLEQAQ